MAKSGPKKPQTNKLGSLRPLEIPKQSKPKPNTFPNLIKMK